jgi:hypothetical protein
MNLNRAHPDVWQRRMLALLVALLCLVTACSSGGSGPGVASASGGSSSANAQRNQGKSVLAYARCMRSHGVKDYPDPNGQGELQLNAGPGSDLDPNNPRYKAADAACKALLPPAQAPPAGFKAANLKYAKCMRTHGVSDFPDPKADGTLQIQAEPGSDLDPNNPQYKAANEACRHLLPDGGRGGSVSSKGSG